MHQSPYFPTSYGVYGADLAPGYYVGPGDWIYNVASPTDITVAWSPQSKKALNQKLSGSTASKAYAELQGSRPFPSLAAALDEVLPPTEESRKIWSDLAAEGVVPPLQEKQGEMPVATGSPKGMGRRRPGRGRGGAPAPASVAAPAAVPTWVYVGIGAVALLAVVGIAVASRK